MTKDLNTNTSAECGIEKFEGSFEKEELGVTIIPNSSISDIKNPEALGLYIYLLSRPSGWQLKSKQLCSHFNICKDKLYRLLNFLLSEGYITCVKKRLKGKFSTPIYRVHLHKSTSPLNPVDFEIDQPETPVVTGFEPYPEKPDTVKPDTVNQDAYKTYNIKNINTKSKNTLVDLKSTVVFSGDYRDDLLFMEFYRLYPHKQKPVVARATFYRVARRMNISPAELLNIVKEDLPNRIANNWSNRPKEKIPFPATYLNGREWEGDICPVEIPFRKAATQYKSWDEIVEGLA